LFDLEINNPDSSLVDLKTYKFQSFSNAQDQWLGFDLCFLQMEWINDQDLFLEFFKWNS
jgi:hypothetical protein